MRHRRSFFATGMRSGLVWLCVPFIIGGGICLVVALRLVWVEWQYHFSARKTNGTVLKKLRSTNPTGGFGGTGTSRGVGPTSGGVNYTIRYQYHTAQGRAWEDEDDVSASYWEKLQPGDSLRVFYLPKLPNHSRLWIGIRAFLPVILFLVDAPMTFLGVLGEFLIVGELQRKHLKKQQTIPSMRQPPVWSEKSKLRPTRLGG